MKRRPIGPHIPLDLFDRCNFEPYIKVLHAHIDDEGYMRGERINGFDQCPKCGLWWPNIEEPCAWEEYDGERKDLQGKWIAIEWWGGTICDDCNLLMVDQPDGTGECYQL